MPKKQKTLSLQEITEGIYKLETKEKVQIKELIDIFLADKKADLEQELKLIDPSLNQSKK